LPINSEEKCSGSPLTVGCGFDAISSSRFILMDVPAENLRDSNSVKFD
jgi:hypothetical protein